MSGGRLLRSPAFARLLIVALALLAHVDALRNEFHFDDYAGLVANPYIRDLGNLPKYFTDATTLTTLPENQAYRPLGTLSYALDCAWGGMRPEAFRLTQIAWHALLALLLHALLRALLARGAGSPRTEPLALFGGALFAVHPLSVELVNIIFLRTEIIAAAGALAAVLLYLRHPAARRGGLWLLPMALGALAKPTALVAAPLVAAAILLGLDGGGPGRARRAAVAGGGAAALALALQLFIQRMSGPHLSYGNMPRGVYLQTQCFAWFHYLRAFALPAGLTADPEFAPIPNWHDTRVVFGALFALGLLAAAALYACRRPRHGAVVLFGILWFYLALAPSSSVLPLPDMIYNYRCYFPALGLVVALCAAADDAAARLSPRLLGALGAALVLAAGCATAARNTAWRDRETLWEDVVRENPRAVRGWSQLGYIYLGRGDLEGAERAWRIAVELEPKYDPPALGLALVMERRGDTAGAERQIRSVIELWPERTAPHNAYGNLLLRLGRGAEAETQFRESLRYAPADDQALVGLLEALRAQGRRRDYCETGRGILARFPTEALAKALTAHCTGEVTDAPPPATAPPGSAGSPPAASR